MPAPDRDPPIKIIPDSTRFPKGIVGVYTDVEVDALLANVAVGNVDLTGYAKTEDLPIVYEQNTEPTGKDGDLWLKPLAASDEAQVLASAMSKDVLSSEIQRIVESQPKTLTEEETRTLVRSMMTGGKEPPPDMPWTACQQVAGAGLVEARVINGMIQLRGTITITTSSWTLVRRLPASFPKPPVECATVVTGGESGVAERVCQVALKTDGGITINSFANKITAINLYPASAPVV